MQLETYRAPSVRGEFRDRVASASVQFGQKWKRMGNEAVPACDAAVTVTRQHTLVRS